MLTFSCLRVVQIRVSARLREERRAAIAEAGHGIVAPFIHFALGVVVSRPRDDRRFCGRVVKALCTRRYDDTASTLVARVRYETVLTLRRREGVGPRPRYELRVVLKGTIFGRLGPEAVLGGTHFGHFSLDLVLVGARLRLIDWWVLLEVDLLEILARDAEGVSSRCGSLLEL